MFKVGDRVIHIGRDTFLNSIHEVVRVMKDRNIVIARQLSAPDSMHNYRNGREWALLFKDIRLLTPLDKLL